MELSKPQPDVAVIKMYQAHQEIYPREISGRFASLRWLCVVLTQAVFYGTPWLHWNDRQAVLFDLAARKFYIFGIVLWPQDFIYLAALLIICAYGLFLVTAVAGRVWCGFGCPQTVYTEIFLWIERKIEGTRSARLRLAKQPWSAEKLAKRSAKHAAWIALAGWTGVTFVAYFTPAQQLLREIGSLTLGPWEWFWVIFYSFATYGNAGHMREQVCKYMCPYARFQSAMFDKDTLIITYDQLRGEPRSAAVKKLNDDASRSGDCIDCSMCVQVCPVGIDIRHGLQYECIGCAACVDACDLVMDKIKRPTGLIRYATEHALSQRLSAEQIRRRMLRPRILLYTGLLVILVAALSICLLTRTPLKMDVIRDRGSMGREVDNGAIENVYRLQIMNTAEQRRRFHLSVEGIATIALETPDEIVVDAATALTVPVRVRVDHGTGVPGSNKIRLKLQASDDPGVFVNERAVFLIPR